MVWQIGDSATTTRVITDSDIVKFADVSGDDQPLHLDPAFAATTRFGGVVAHGMLSGAIFSAVLGKKIPGEGAVLLGMNLSFHKPVRPGDEITYRAEITDISPKGVMDIRLTAVNAAQEEVASGTTKVLYRP